MIDDHLDERFARLASETTRTLTVPPLEKLHRHARQQKRQRLIIGSVAAAAVCAAVIASSLFLTRDVGDRAHPMPAVTPTAPATPTGQATPTGAANPENNFGPNAVSFLSVDQGWALSPGTCSGCGSLAATTDGGSSWHTVKSNIRLPGRPASLTSGDIGMYFADDHDGYLYARSRCEESCLLATSDGGHTWQATPLGVVDQLVSSDDTGASTATLYALARPPGGGLTWLYRAAVGGHDWARLPLPTRAAAASDAFVAAGGSTVTVLERGNYDTLGRLWVSTDRGQTWVQLPVPCTGPQVAASAVSVALGHPKAMLVACNAGEPGTQGMGVRHQVYGSTDAGRSWTRLGDAPRDGAAVLLADTGTGHAFLALESGAGNVLTGSLDGGRHWRKLITSNDAVPGWAGLRFVSSSTGFIFGPTHNAPEQLYRTTDGGRTWHQVNLPRP